MGKEIKIQTPSGASSGGGIVLMELAGPPKKVSLPQLAKAYLQNQARKPHSFYSGDTKVYPTLKSGSGGNGKKSKIGLWILLIGVWLVVMIIMLIVHLTSKKSQT